MTAGRPPKYKTAKEIQKVIDRYFKECPDTIKMPTKEGVVIELPVLTITGLVYYLGFESRTAFYDYEKKEEFKYTIKRARLFIEMEYEKQLRSGNVTGAIFALKNFGWKDKQEIEQTNYNYNNMTDEDLDKRIKELE